MAKMKNVNQSVKYPRRGVASRTEPLDFREVLKTLEERLLKACKFHLDSKGSEKVRAKIKRGVESSEKILSLFVEIDNAFADLNKLGFFGLASKYKSHKAIFEAIRENLKSNIAIGHLSKMQKGHPRLNEDLCLLLYAAIENAKGNRPLLDAIGNTIAPWGPLAREVDKMYGAHTFDSLMFPLVHKNNDPEYRWERSCKANLKKRAEEFYKKRLFAHLSEKKTFDEIVQRGGISLIEHFERVA